MEGTGGWARCKIRNRMNRLFFVNRLWIEGDGKMGQTWMAAQIQTHVAMKIACPIVYHASYIESIYGRNLYGVYFRYFSLQHG